MKRVVIIDDSEIILESIKIALEDIGCHVTALTEPSRSCFSGEHTPDLILLDVNMPQAFGDDLAMFFREAWGMSCNIYLYSSLSAEELATKAEASGANGYICKSWGKDRLIEEVQKILGLAQDETEHTGSEEDLENTEESMSQQAMQTINHRFARRCLERRDNILKIFDTHPSERTLRSVALQLHDFIGESKLLGLDRVAVAASSLKDVVEQRGMEILKPQPLERFRTCLIQLADLAQRMALETPDANLISEIKALRSDFMDDAAFEITEEDFVSSEDLELILRRILVFDDSPIVREVLSLELEKRGHEVAVASCLNEFNQHLHNFDPDIIFLDVAMPEMSGPELCHHLRHHFQTRKPIIFVSSLPEEELDELAQRSGADGYLSKQRGMDELIKYLDDLLQEIIF